jgi:hypothetical protein
VKAQGGSEEEEVGQTGCVEVEASWNSGFGTGPTCIEAVWAVLHLGGVGEPVLLGVVSQDQLPGSIEGWGVESTVETRS